MHELRGSCILKTMALIVFASTLAQPQSDPGRIIDLQPEAVASLPESAGVWRSLRVVEMRAASEAIWFLVNSRIEPKRFAIIAIATNGRRRTLIDLPPAMGSNGFVLTAAGIVAAMNDSTQSTLIQYGWDGSVRRRSAIPCISNLLVIKGAVSAVCPDGIISVYGESEGASPLRLTSWIRPGTKVEVLPDQRLVIVDEATMQAVMDDLNTSRLSVLPIEAPEIEEAVRYTQYQKAEYQRRLRVDDPPLGRPVLAMDTAVDADGWYILVWPYHERLGPAVVKFGCAGESLARFRCRMPAKSRGSFHKLEIQNRDLILSTTQGDVFRYRVR